MRCSPSQSGVEGGGIIVHDERRSGSGPEGWFVIDDAMQLFGGY
jgi:hypothetical protein